MTRTYEAPRTYRPSASLLGRSVRTWTGDRLRGEAIYLVAVTTLTVGLLLAHYLSWALLNPIFSTSPTWEIIFWIGQAVSILALIGVGLVGFRPTVRVTCRPTDVTINQGERSRTLRPSDMEGVSLISAQRYHRHYRRYAETAVYVSTVPDQVICIRTSDGPIVVGLPEPEARAVLDHLKTLSSSHPPNGPSSSANASVTPDESAC